MSNCLNIYMQVHQLLWNIQWQISQPSRSWPWRLSTAAAAEAAQGARRAPAGQEQPARRRRAPLPAGRHLRRQRQDRPLLRRPPPTTDEAAKDKPQRRRRWWHQHWQWRRRRRSWSGRLGVKHGRGAAGGDDQQRRLGVGAVHAGAPFWQLGAARRPCRRRRSLELLN